MPSFIRPSAVTRITASFADHVNRKPTSANPGVDYGAATGTWVRSPAAGRVTGAQWSTLVGWWIHIDHDNGWGSDLLHNSQLHVKVGDRVKAGEHIADSGGTGSLATGPHIHWSLRPRHGAMLLNAGNVDAEKYVVKPVILPTTRTAGGGGVYLRFAPSSKAPLLGTIPAGEAHTVIAYTRAGEAIKGNSIWFKMKGGGYAWSGGFTSETTTGLTPEAGTSPAGTPTPPTPVPVPPVPVPPKGPTQVQYDALKSQLADAVSLLKKQQDKLDAIKKVVSG